jgi:DNA-binding NtrC family response regulator
MTTVWLVEHDEAFREVLAEALREEGFEVRLCSRSSDLIGGLTATADNVAVLDGWGVSYSGLDCEERWALKSVAATLPTIVVSSRTWVEQERADELGLVALLRKPIDLDQLLDSVEGAAATNR